jgi:dihydroorotate dehydrogenase (NAD+) catalytic subunit
MVYRVAQKVKIPIIGCGGITTANDALEFIMAGASAIQVGTANFTNPSTPLDIIDSIRSFMKKEGSRSLPELIGAAL